MDTLQELPVDQWPVLQEKLKALWPLNASGYYALQTNFKHPRIREAFQFKVYCPYGDMDNGFIATSVKVNLTNHNYREMSTSSQVCRILHYIFIYMALC